MLPVYDSQENPQSIPYPITPHVSVKAGISRIDRYLIALEYCRLATNSRTYVDAIERAVLRMCGDSSIGPDRAIQQRNRKLAFEAVRRWQDSGESIDHFLGVGQ